MASNLNNAETLPSETVEAQDMEAVIAESRAKLADEAPAEPKKRRGRGPGKKNKESQGQSQPSQDTGSNAELSDAQAQQGFADLIKSTSGMAANAVGVPEVEYSDNESRVTGLAIHLGLKKYAPQIDPETAAFMTAVFGAVTILGKKVIIVSRVKNAQKREAEIRARAETGNREDSRNQTTREESEHVDPWNGQPLSFDRNS